MIAYRTAREALDHGCVVACIPGQVDDEACIYTLWRPMTLDAIPVAFSPDPRIRATFLISFARGAHEKAQRQGVIV